MKRILSLVAAAAIMGTGLGAGAANAGIASVVGLTSVNIMEITYYYQIASFAPNDARLTTRLSTLTAANRDFGFFAGDENYDVFYSDANGAFNANGSFLTIEGNCGVPYNCFNISAIWLTRNGPQEHAYQLTNAVYGRAGSFTPGSAANAADVNTGSYTQLGDTIGLPASARMSVTVGFASVPTGGVPEPASWALMIAGFGMVGAAQRRVLRARLQPKHLQPARANG